MKPETLTLPGGVTATFTPSVSITCRCGVRVRIGTGEGFPGHPAGTPMGLHDQPYCDHFKRLDLLAYMRWVRTGTAYPS